MRFLRVSRLAVESARRTALLHIDASDSTV